MLPAVRARLRPKQDGDGPPEGQEEGEEEEPTYASERANGFGSEDKQKQVTRARIGWVDAEQVKKRSNTRRITRN